MFGAIIFIVFFAIFTTASILLPVQFFPGSLLENLAIIPEEYEQYVSAIANGLVYSTIAVSYTHLTLPTILLV